MEFQSMESGLLPMKRGRLIKTLSDSTIKGVMDALVELITNCDDSYTNSEQKGKVLSGEIVVEIKRGRGGHCKEIIVSDQAEGMDYQKLKRAIEFSAETSGFMEGRGVRGFFGRGLKESIIALGRGTILTLSGGVLSKAEIYYDADKKDAVYNLSIPIMNTPEEELIKYGLLGKSGTVIKLEIQNEKKDYVPSRQTIENQLSNHFSLRDINSSPKRRVRLDFYDIESKEKFHLQAYLKYVPPEGNLVFEMDIPVDSASVHYKIFESNIQLESPKNADGKSGLLIKSEGAILDNSLFGFETDPNGLFFYGEIICPQIAKSVREGDESIVDFNRGGLDWKHPFNKLLEEKSKAILEDLVKKRKEKMNLQKDAIIAAPIDEMLRKLCKKLGDLAKEEVEDSSEPAPGEINGLIIRPVFANIELNTIRNFSIYCPKYLVNDEGSAVVNIAVSGKEVSIVNSEITLEESKNKNNEEILKGQFKVKGEIDGGEATITASLGKLLATCEVRVAEAGHKEPTKPQNGVGGFFRKITPALDDDPIQRFFYVQGTIKVYVKFPSITNFLGENFDKVGTPEGRMILAEILIEAFCRTIASKRVGKIYSDESGLLMGDMDRLRKKVTPVVYSIILHSNLSEIIGESEN